jgi:lipopolysaccharide export LptBFGC system permease protein LptF
MKTKTFFLALLFAGASALFAQQTHPKAGADKDAHGCIASAGYTYSQLKKECIRTFEQKIQLKEIATKGNYTAAFLFNKDQSKVEIFLKEEKMSVILNRTSKRVWKNAAYTLKKNKGFVLSKNKKAVYKS